MKIRSRRIDQNINVPGHGKFDNQKVIIELLNHIAFILNPTFYHLVIQQTSKILCKIAKHDFTSTKSNMKTLPNLVFISTFAESGWAEISVTEAS